MTVKPEGRKLLRVKARNAQTPIEDRPWQIRNQVRSGPNYKDMKNRVSGVSLHTVCQEAGYPNIHECWEDCKATFFIDGDRYTRRCDFCQVNSARPDPLDKDEPRRVAESVREMGLRYATITGVACDDLPDGASWFYAETYRQVHELSPNTGVKLLVDDFRGGESATQQVLNAKPKVFVHSLETVPRIFKRIRSAFRYEHSLELITRARETGLVTKSNLILGMGESHDEIIPATEDLYGAGCDILTITQYLHLTPLHHPIERWVRPGGFVRLSKVAEEMGFVGVMSGPLVRPSYHAGRLYARTLAYRDQELPAYLSALANDSDNNLAFQEASTLLDRCDASEDTPVASTTSASQRLTAAAPS